MPGWVKTYRQLINWEWYQDSQMVHLLIHLILSANFEDRKWRGLTIKRGQLLTSRRKLSTETGISERSIRTCLERLKSTSEVTIKTTNRNTVITVTKYDTYQSNEGDTDQLNDQQDVQQTTSKRPATDQPSLKNYKKDKNIKEKESVREKENENETNPKKLEFDRFNDWVDEKIPYLRKIRDQITYEQYCSLTEKYNGEQIRYILTALANYKDAPKKYVSVNLTFQKWAKKEYNG